MIDKSLKSAASWFSVSAVLAFGWVLGFGSAHRFWSQETAAWVQAVGSIAAVIGAYIFGERQAQHARRLEKERRDAEIAATETEEGNLRRARAEYALAAAHRATAMVGVWLRELRVEKSAPEGRRLRHHRAAYQVSALDRYPIDRIPITMLGFFVSLAGNLNSIIRTYPADTHTPTADEMSQLDMVWDWSKDSFDSLRLIAINECGRNDLGWLPDWKNWEEP